MRILIVNDAGLTGGGAETRIKSLITGIEDRGIECAVLANASAPHLHQRWYATTPKDAEQMLTHAIDDFKPDIVQFHNISQLSARLIPHAKSKGAKTIFFAHDFWPICGKGMLFASWGSLCTTRSLIKCSACVGPANALHIKMNMPAVNQADIGIATTNTVIRTYEHNNILKGKWLKIPGWINATFFAASHRKPQHGVILYIGPLMPYKGWNDLLPAFITVAKELPEAQLRIVGPGQESPERHQADALLKRHGLHERVDFIGYKDAAGIRNELSRAAILISPTRCAETFGQTWAQALAVGCPVIATPFGSIPEAAGDHVTYAKPHELAQKIQEALKNPRKQRRVLLSEKEPIQQLVTLYHRLCA